MIQCASHHGRHTVVFFLFIDHTYGRFLLTKGLFMNKFTFIGDSKTKEFFFKFPFFTKQDIFVKINSTTTTDFKLFPTTSGMNADTPFNGGRIQFKKPPKSGDIITICRKLELNRHIDYQPTAPLNPTTLNQDMNFMLEILKDMHNELTDLSEKYSEIADTDSTKLLITKINTVISRIDKLGDISNIYPNLDTLNTGINELNTAITHATNNIRTLNNFKNDINDYVIEYQRPTPENNFTWYRKYKSGWVEMGGESVISAQMAHTQLYTDVNLPLTMANQAYLVNIAFITDGGSTTGLRNNANGRGTTKLTIGTYSTTEISQSYRITWEVKGLVFYEIIQKQKMK